MATLIVSVSASFSDVGGTDTISPRTAQIESLDCATLRNQSVSTTAVNLTFPSATNRSFALVSNTGETNAILMSLDEGSTWPISVPAGAVQPLFLSDDEMIVKIKAAADSTSYDVLTV